MLDNSGTQHTSTIYKHNWYHSIHSFRSLIMHNMLFEYTAGPVYITLISTFGKEAIEPHIISDDILHITFLVATVYHTRTVLPYQVCTVLYHA
jgi:hypothetical protein